MTLPPHERRWDLLLQVRDGLRDAARNAAKLEDLAYMERDRDLHAHLRRLLSDVERDLGIPRRD